MTGYVVLHRALLSEEATALMERDDVLELVDLRLGDVSGCGMLIVCEDEAAAQSVFNAMQEPDGDLWGAGVV